MKNKIILPKLLLLGLWVALLAQPICLTSCASGKKSSDNRDARSDDGGGAAGRKKKAKKCKIASCHVRMKHMHEGTEYKGKSSWFLKDWFYFGKDPKYGEGMRREKVRDPHQGRRN
jgi:hypothetical protein